MKVKIDADESIYISNEKAYLDFKNAGEKVGRYIHHDPKSFPCLAFEAGEHRAFFDASTVFYYYVYEFTFTDHDL
jgi:hypothetical protein